jgi:hypothetical protein
MTFESQGKFFDTTAGDLLIHIESPQRCFSSVQLTGRATTGTQAYNLAIPVAGFPLIAGNIPAIDTEEASVVALVVFGNPWPLIAADADTAEIPPYTIINDFTGAVINQNAIQDTDLAGATMDVAAIAAALVALGAKIVTEPVKITEQKGGTPA